MILRCVDLCSPKGNELANFFNFRRVLQAMHHAKVEETIAQAKALMKAMKTGGMVAEVSFLTGLRKQQTVNGSIKFMTIRC